MSLQNELNIDLLKLTGLHANYLELDSHCRSQLMSFTLRFASNSRVLVSKMNEDELLEFRSEVLNRLKINLESH